MLLKALAPLKKKVDTKAAGIICVILAIVNKSLVALAFSSLKGDKALYLLFAQSFLKTGKLTEPVNIIETGTANYLFDPAFHSPLYSLIASPLLWLTGSFFLTQYLISVAGWVMVFVALYQLAFVLFRQRWLVHLFLLFSGFFLYPHETSSTPKDTIALALVLWSVVLMHGFFITPSKRKICLLALVFCSLALIKLMYVPLMAALLFLFTVFVLLERKKALLVHLGLLIGLIVLIGFCVQQFLFEPVNEAAASQAIRLPRNESVASKGFYPNNLLYTYPFISSSIINTELWGVQVERLSSLSFTEVMQWLLRLDVLLLGLSIVTALVYSRQLVANRSWFFLVGAAFVMTAVTLGLSVSEQAIIYQSSNSGWTYAADSRSFLVPIIVIQLALFAFIFKYEKLAFIRLVVVCLFLLECLHGIYFTAKQAAQANFATEANGKDDALQKITRLVEENEKKPALVTTDRFLRRYAQVKNLKAYAFSNVEADLRWMKKGEVFLIATHAGDADHLQKFPLANLKTVGTIEPFVLHLYTVR